MNSKTLLFSIIIIQTFSSELLTENTSNKRILTKNATQGLIEYALKLLKKFKPNTTWKNDHKWEDRYLQMNNQQNFVLQNQSVQTNQQPSMTLNIVNLLFDTYTQDIKYQDEIDNTVDLQRRTDRGITDQALETKELKKQKYFNFCKKFGAYIRNHIGFSKYFFDMEGAIFYFKEQILQKHPENEERQNNLSLLNLLENGIFEKSETDKADYFKLFYYTWINFFIDQKGQYNLISNN